MWIATGHKFGPLGTDSKIVFSEVHKHGFMDMRAYEKLPNTEFSIKNITCFFEKYFFQNSILGNVGKSGGVPRVVWKG